MLTLTLDDPSDLPNVLAQREAARSAYRQGRAVSLIVKLPGSRDPQPIPTSYGPACGDSYPLSSRFISDMRQATEALAGPANGPGLYVTVGDQVSRLNCGKTSRCKYGPDEQTLHYYEAFKDRYVQTREAILAAAPNARVGIGWEAWCPTFELDEGGGQRMLDFFSDVMRISDFVSFDAIDDDLNQNPKDIRNSIYRLGKFAPVMLAFYEPSGSDPATMDSDLRTMMTPAFLEGQISHGLFAFAFTDDTIFRKSPAVEARAEQAVRAFGRLGSR